MKLDDVERIVCGDDLTDVPELRCEPSHQPTVMSHVPPDSTSAASSRLPAPLDAGGDSCGGGDAVVVVAADGGGCGGGGKWICGSTHEGPVRTLTT